MDREIGTAAPGPQPPARAQDVFATGDIFCSVGTQGDDAEGSIARTASTRLVEPQLPDEPGTAAARLRAERRGGVAGTRLPGGT